MSPERAVLCSENVAPVDGEVPRVGFSFGNVLLQSVWTDSNDVVCVIRS